MESRKDRRESPVHYDFLDGIRAVLALYVVAHHVFLTEAYEGPGLNPVWGVFNYGQLAVIFFLVLSGFCLCLPVLETGLRVRDTITFFKRRAWRILPPYYFAMAFSLVLTFLFIHERAGLFWARSLPITTSALVTHLMLIHNFFPSQFQRVNYVFWSIAVEWQVYFFFPPLLMCWRRWGALPATFGAVLVSLLVEQGLLHYFGLYPCADFIGLFALGMLAAWISFSADVLAGKMRAWPWRMIAAISFAATCILYHPAALEAKTAFGCFACSVLVIASIHREGWLHRALSVKPLAALGSISYSIYLIHAPLLAMVWKYPLATLHMRPDLTCAVMMIGGLPAILVASYLFHLGFERPFVPRRVAVLEPVADV